MIVFPYLNRRAPASATVVRGVRSSAPATLIACAALLAACTGDTVDDPLPGSGQASAGDSAGAGGDSGGDTGGETGGDTGGDSSGGGSSPPPVTGGAITLELAPVSETLSEGDEDGLVLPVSVARADGHDLTVTLEALEDGAGESGLEWRFADATLEAGESETTLSVTLPIGPYPRQEETRVLSVVATDAGGTRAFGEIVLEVTPTERPDIYLLAGQSNMVGASREGAREAGPGEPDAPDPRIRQLDVTINDGIRFPTPSSYTAVSSIAVPNNRIVEALDPLHDTRDRGKDTKGGTTIGLGLSFAKAALAATTAEVVLVPAAWSDTGFCRRATNRFPGTGWNAEEQDSPAFAGTLLLDRAIARTNLAIEETGGILRGILWHQGEADSDVRDCALQYDENLRDMVAAMRTRIDVDARGEVARGAEADIPFVVGTMSKGADERGGALAPFGETKSIVDAVHRGVAEIVPFADVVNADDLVPEAYPCGQGFCIHFGAEALRELGERYHERLRAVAEEG